MRKFVMTILFLMAVFACINAYTSAATAARGNESNANKDISSK